MRYSSSPFDFALQFIRENKLLSRMLALLLLIFALFNCWLIGSSHNSKSSAYDYHDVPLSKDELDRDFSYLQATDLDQVVDSATMRELASGDSNETIEINEGGDYLLSGKLTGMVFIDAKEQNVHLFLDGLELLSKSGPAIYCKDADKLIITLVDGSNNTITDSGDYRDYDDIEACIYSECDMTINGTGSLVVKGYYKDAIQSKDVVKILGGTFEIKCKRTAIRGNDGIFVNGGEFLILSEKNGFKTTKHGEDGRGSLIIAGGEMNIIAGRYAFITTKANLYIYDCTINSHSIVDTFDVGGLQLVQRGCIDER